MSKKKEEATVSKRRRRRPAGFPGLTILTLLLGALVGREIHRYEVKHVDDIRVKQLIEALEKKPVKVEIYPLVPFRVPPKPLTNGTLDSVAETSRQVSCVEEDYLWLLNSTNGFHLDTP